MADPLTIQEFADLADQRFGEIADGVEERRPDMIPDLYTKRDSNLVTERGSALTPMGPLQVFTGVGRISTDGPDQGFDWSATHVEKALGIEIQRRLWRFDLFSMIENTWELLLDSAFETRQVDAAEILNEGHSVTSLLNFTHSRNEAMFANTHTPPDSTVGTTGTDNLITSSLSRTALNSARTTALTLRDDRGRVRGFPLDTLIIPPNLLPTAEVLIKSDKEPDTTLNAINPNADRFQIVVWDQLADTNDYLIVNKQRLKERLRWFEADAVEIQRVLDYETQIAKYAAYTQYTTAWTDWRVGIKATVT